MTNKQKTFHLKKNRIIAPAFFLLILFSTFISCSQNGNNADANGYFEADETIVSSQANGMILELNIEEGENFLEKEMVGQIDTTQLYLTLLQLQSQRGAVLSRKPDIEKQTASLKEQIVAAQRELQRVENLAKGNAATSKQVDDVRTQVSLLQKQLEAAENQLQNNTQSITKESNPIAYQIAILEDQIEKTKIINPISGTILAKYAKKNEMTGIGKPLYKIANLDEIILRIYITNAQLSSIKIGQKVDVMIDQSENNQKNYEGFIEWISSKAEFTPKTIQTKEERSNQVFAVKIRVKNDGYLKIGMYGEVKFQ